MNYRVIGYAMPSAGQQLLIPSVAVDQTRYESVERSKRVCLLAVVFEERFQMVVDNFEDWEVELISQAQSGLLLHLSDQTDAMQRRLRLDLYLVNLLTVCRLYLDQTDHGLSQCFGNPSTELTEIKNFKSRIYDD